MSLTGIPELKASYRKLGPRVFWMSTIGTLFYIGIGSWFAIEAVWPDQCDHEGRGIIGLAKSLYCSPELLKGGAIEIGLFIWWWSLPTIVIVTVVWSWTNHWKRSRGALKD